jgi:uncharacterized membrane protein
MSKLIITLSCCLALFLACEPAAKAQTNTADSGATDLTVTTTLPADLGTAANPKMEYYKAQVIKLSGNQKTNDSEVQVPVYIQKVEVMILNGPEAGADITDAAYYPKTQDSQELLKVGDTVYLIKATQGNQIDYTVAEHYRIDKMWWLLVFFLILVIVIGRWKGFGSILGLIFSFFVIIKLMLPQILAGQNPLWICLWGAILIAVVSIYIAHGFNLRISLAVISTIATIALALAMDYAVIHWLQLFGDGTEEAVYAQFSQSGGIINLRGLLLGGIIIGVLGVLDDITTAQAAVVDEIYKANPRLTFKQLYQGGLSVGKEHIASLINTLVLAYVGASFPLILLFHYYQQPLSYILNSELVAEEIARALIGSTALILAVPLTTAVTAAVLHRRGRATATAEDNPASGHLHYHH